LAVNVAAKELLLAARAAPIYLSSSTTRATIKRLAAAVEASEAAPETIGASARWRLLATTRTQGSELLQLMDANPALGEFQIFQITHPGEENGRLRVNNGITIARAADADWRSAWTLLAPGGQSSLVLEHDATVECSGSCPRVSLTLRRAVLDGTRRGSDKVEEILGVPLPNLPAGLEELVRAEAATYDVTFEDEMLRVTRGVTRGERPVLRVFERIIGGE